MRKSDAKRSAELLRRIFDKLNAVDAVLAFWDKTQPPAVRDALCSYCRRALAQTKPLLERCYGLPHTEAALDEAWERVSLYSTRLEWRREDSL